MLGIAATESYSADPETTVIKAELSRILGVRLTATIRDFGYDAFGVTERTREPPFVRQWYSRASVFREALTDNPMTLRTALLISFSFGVFAVRHLAPAYRRIVHINVNNVLPEEGTGFLENVVRRVAPDDLIFMFHDESVAAEGRRMYQYLFGEN